MLGQGVGALKRRGGLEPPYQLCLWYSVLKLQIYQSPDILQF